MWALKEHFGDQPFVRGNLDAGRLNFVFGREVVAAEDPFDPESYDALLKLLLGFVIILIVAGTFLIIGSLQPDFG